MVTETETTDWLTWGPLAVMFAGLLPLTAGTLLLAWTGVFNRRGPGVGVSGMTLMAIGFALLVGGLLALEAVAVWREEHEDLEGLVPVGLAVGAAGLLLGVGPGVLRKSVLGPLPSLVGAVALLSNAWFGMRLRRANREQERTTADVRADIEPTGPDVPDDERDD